MPQRHRVAPSHRTRLAHGQPHGTQRDCRAELSRTLPAASSASTESSCAAKTPVKDQASSQIAFWRSG